MKKHSDAYKRIEAEQAWEASKIGRFCYEAVFKLGYSKCRHCIYCNGDGTTYRGFRESFLLRAGKCHWSENSLSASLTYEDLRKYHRCPAFIPILYNFKNYAIPAEKVKEIRYLRTENYFKWLGWIFAVLIALLKK